MAVPTPDEIAKQFTANYQPIIDLNTGAVAGFEALADEVPALTRVLDHPGQPHVRASARLPMSRRNCAPSNRMRPTAS